MPAMTCSRASPSTREAMVAIETRPASAATLRRFAGVAAAPGACVGSWGAAGRPTPAVPTPGGSPAFDPASNGLLGSATMTPVQAGILGILQGLSEFLPISSSAHLALAHWWFGWGDPEANVPFDVALHLGTLIAVFVYFSADLMQFARGTFASFASRKATPEAKQVGVLLLATVPAAVLGLAFKHAFE